MTKEHQDSFELKNKFGLKGEGIAQWLLGKLGYKDIGRHDDMATQLKGIDFSATEIRIVGEADFSIPIDYECKTEKYVWWDYKSNHPRVRNFFAELVTGIGQKWEKKGGWVTSQSDRFVVVFYNEDMGYGLIFIFKTWMLQRAIERYTSLHPQQFYPHLYHKVSSSATNPKTGKKESWENYGITIDVRWVVNFVFEMHDNLFWDLPNIEMYHFDRGIGYRQVDLYKENINDYYKPVANKQVA